jgi:hypothetical protein
MTSRRYQAIDEHVAVEIRRLHDQYPKLGHHGMLEALRQANFQIDPSELERFMKEHRMKPERPWRPLPLRGLPAWLGGLGGRDKRSP